MQPAPPSSLPQFIFFPLFPGRPPASKGNLIAFIKVSIVGAVATRKGRRKQLLGLTKHLPLFFHRYGRLRRLHLPSHPGGIVRRRAGTHTSTIFREGRRGRDENESYVLRYYLEVE